MTHSASFFAIKILTDPTIPANAGIPRPVEMKIPEGSFLDAAAPRGRVRRQHRDDAAHRRHGFEGVRPVRARAHTSSQPGHHEPIRSASVASTRAAAEPYTYIETIAGGQGGRPAGDGMDGVQCNMTNTMNTPVEALEISYPLRVERYEIARGVGGARDASRRKRRGSFADDHRSRGTGLLAVGPAPICPLWIGRGRRRHARLQLDT